MNSPIWIGLAAACMAAAMGMFLYAIVVVARSLRESDKRTPTIGMQCPTCDGIIAYRPGIGGECPSCKTFVG